jgi:hypothetical protein
MDVNPYESPRTEKPFSEGTLPGSDAIRQVLVEIRDTQRELLQLQRDALVRQRGMQRYSYLMFIPIMIFVGISMYFSMTRIRALPPVPARSAPRAFPPVAPQPVPKPAYFQQP